MDEKFLCPCHSKKRYAECCQPYHEGKVAENALKLMRSRYAAYALKLVDYIVQTTYLKGVPLGEMPKWREQILEFAKMTVFYDLKILEFVDGHERAFVTFKAYLKQGDKDVSFKERSAFIKVQDRWFYEKGEIT
jgi:SEC-C motif domain protein